MHHLSNFMPLLVLEPGHLARLKSVFVHQLNSLCMYSLSSTADAKTIVDHFLFSYLICVSLKTFEDVLENYSLSLNMFSYEDACFYKLFIPSANITLTLREKSEGHCE